MAGVSSPVLVRCSGTKDGIPCEFTSSEEFYFCPVCGSSSQSNLPSPTITVIKCPGRKNPCGTPIASDSTYNFCKKCGWKIDISLFLQSVKTCPGVKDDGSLCNADLEEGTNYCTNCGYFIEESNEDQSNNIGNIRIGTLGDKSVHSEVETSTVSAKKHDYVDKNKAPNQNKPNKSDDDEVSNGDRLPLTASAASSNGGKPQSSGTEKDTDGGKSTSSVTDKDSDRVKTPSTGTDNSSNGGKPPSSGTDKGSDKEKHTSSGTDKGKNGGKPLSSWTDKGSDKGKPPSSGNDKASDGEKHTSSGTHKGSNGENPTAFGTNVDSDRGKATSSMNDKSSNVGKHIDPDDENESKIAQETGEETEDCDVSSDEDGDSDNDDDQGDQQEKEERGVRGSSVDPVTKTTLSKSNEISDTSRDNDGRPTNTDEHTKTKALENQYNGGKPKKKKKKKKRGKKKKEEKEGAVQMETKDWDSDDTVEVNFHVLISDAFKLNPNTDKVYVSFHHPYLGGWEGYDKWIMKLEQSENGIIYYTCQVPMPKLVFDRPLLYQYVVHKKHKNKIIRETVYDERHSQRSTGSRFFHMPRGCQQLKTPLDQYDGYVYPKLNESYLQRILKAAHIQDVIHQRITMDIQIATQFFMPSSTEVKSAFQNDTNIAESLAEKVTIILHQMAQKTGSRCHDFKAQFLNDYCAPLLHQVETLKQDKHFKGYEGVLCLVFILTLFKKNSVKFKVFQLKKRHLKNMLMQPDMANKTCHFLKALENHFPSLHRDIFQMVFDLIHECSKVLITENGNVVDSSWLYLVSLLHFLRKDSIPFVKVFTTEHSDSKWWGHEGLYFAKENLKKEHHWSIPINEVVEDLEFLFDVDYLLPRTIMACVSFEKLKQVTSLQKLPAAVCCGTLKFFGNLYKAELFQIQYFVQCIEEVAKKFRQERKEKQSEHHEISCTLEECFHTRQFGMKMASDVLFHCGRLCNEIVILEAATDLFASSVYECSSHEEKLQNRDEMSLFTEIKTEFRSRIEECWKFVNTSLQNKFIFEELRVAVLQCWNELFKAEFGTEELSDEWKRNVTEAVQKVLLEMNPDACLQLFDTEDLAVDLNEDLQAALTEAAFRSYEEQTMAGQDVILQKTSNFGQFMSSLLEKYWPGDDSEELADHVLTWKPFPLYFKHLDKTQTFLLETATNHLQQAKRVIETVEEMLRNGDIPLKLLKLILNDTAHFQELVKHSQCYDEAETGVMKMVIEARDQELKAFKRDLGHASILLKFAKNIHHKVDSSELVNNFHQMERNLEEEFHINICKPLKVEKITKEALTNYNPKTLISGLSRDTLDIAPELEKLGKSMIFNEMWSKEATKVSQVKDIEQALNVVFQETLKSWRSLCKSVSEGTIPFDKIQLKNCENDIKRIEEEFRMMIGDSRNDLVLERLDQLQKYELLQGCRIAAQIIMEVKNQYDLNGDFGSIEAIEGLASNKSQAMNQLDKSVAKICKVLESWKDEAKQQCIRAFKDSKLLVKWVRDGMADMKEVKVFVDLAFISAGEEEVDIQIVSCFHGAVTGYAPLIFETPQNCDSHVFLDNCNNVLKAFESDPNLPLKLTTASEKLHWLKDVKESHGSVEVTSLMQADNINMRGRYRVGNLQDTKHIGVADLCLDQVITLHVTENSSDNAGPKEDVGPKEYTHNKLVDLQSRLMLVAGKAERGKENVERFVMVLDGVDRLAKTFIRLCTDGCVLFNCWNGEFLCDKNRKVCAVLNFGNDENMETLKGHRGEEDVDNFVVAIANQFEKFHEDWLKYVSDKRDDYLELNHFTIEQLVFLQKELIKLGSEDEPSLLVYPMLSLIKPNCSEADLASAMQEARDAVFSKEDDLVHNKKEEVELGNRDLIDEFMTAMLDSNFSLRLAKRAIVEVGAENIDEGVVWCMDNQEDEDIDDDEGEMEADEKTFGGWHVEEGSVSSSVTAWIQAMSEENRNNTTVPKLLTSLQSIWENFLAAVSSSVADYLSLEHLGIILRELAKKDEEIIDREIPQPFQKGTPNLIVCPQVDLMNAVVYLYKHSEDQPLPRPDEVLLCTPQTTFDQVDIFLRRAFFINPGKVYTLANADLLPYEIEEKVEKKLKEYANKSGDMADYQLVVLCSTENEFKARIVAALERNRCPPPPVHNLQDIKRYLRTKFSQTCSQKDDERQVFDEKEIDEIEDEERRESASKVDFGSSNVRVIKSKRAGVGKSLYKKRQEESLHQRDWMLQQQNPRVQPAVTIHLYNKTVSTTAVADKLLHHTLKQDVCLPRIFHLDVSYEVQEGVDYLLFNLLILGCITNSKGQVWLKSPQDLYLVETIPLQDSRQDRRVGHRLIHPLLEVLPDVHCWSPQESLQILSKGVKPKGYANDDRLFDDQEFRSEVYQRPFQYLKRWSSNSKLDDIDPSEPEGSQQECLQVLLQHCGVRDPAWSELHNFVWFLNTQLEDFERSVFCSDVILEDLPGFPALVLQFLIQMSRDFATRSLVMSEQSPLDELKTEEMEEEDLAQFQMKRTWESSPHPYIFFNPDGHSMTFLGFNIERHTGNMVDQQTGQILEEGLVPPQLQKGLVRNRVNINENFDQMQRLQRLEKLCNVMPGVDFVHDPDVTYELTTDNVKKILAIYMRFRCGIPVIIMGETGCGKTRLVKFMCDLQCPPGSDIENMVIMKVHGGTTSHDIIRKVKQAENLAAENKAKNEHMYTVLFFDEANTTEAIGLIKEIMCDGAIEGQPLRLDENLKIVAACNPYRKHSNELIERLEKAGLGYHVDAEKTTDKLGRVPMRRLVYRVQPLPQSMLPLVWDFGQLNTQVEELYVRQMVNRYVKNGDLPFMLGPNANVVSQILIAAQMFMRALGNECSFVSLRDVDRTLGVMAWFYRQSHENGTLFDRIDEKLHVSVEFEESEEGSEGETSEEESDQDESLLLESFDESPRSKINKLPDHVTKSLILALSVCYRASLRNRDKFDQYIVDYFQGPCYFSGGKDMMVQVIDCCQSIFLDEVHLEDNIAKNLALKENLFMMVVCIELRIPLFLVGKPGSSKSLAKTIVADAMQGNSARSDLFKQLKETRMVSFQCSPLATAEGIVGTFRQCARYQEGKDLTKFVSIVVLDEVGLAEDSPRMPLKTLHPLLEDGCQGDEKAEPHKKVAFIGISNWALDPAKMNRGILVQREVPDDMELLKSAEGICSSEKRELLHVFVKIKPLLPDLARAYVEVFKKAQEARREFFGLRDYYSLVKMVHALVASTGEDLCWHQLEYAVKRNFGGLDNVNAADVFKMNIPTLTKDEESHEWDPDSSKIALIKSGLFGDETNSESRYLLLLTENYGALSILEQQILKQGLKTIFGSSFPKDQEYTQICRNINKIKVYMETGKTVILLNLDNLYESLYDALNQYYAKLGGERFVDLGLGTHRVKCRVHQNFRLIVVAEKLVVYDKFPIPLINRLEKHLLSLDSMMTPEQDQMAEKLDQWALDFVTPLNRNLPGQRNAVKDMREDAFIGYHADTSAAIVLHVWGEKKVESGLPMKPLFDKCKEILLWCASPQYVVRLKDQNLYNEAEWVSEVYWNFQKHEDLFQYLLWKLRDKVDTSLQAQITTHSKLLTDREKEELAKHLSLTSGNIILLTLQSFDTEQQFSQQIKNFIQRCEEGQKLVLIQCGSGDRNQSLIKSAQYCVFNVLDDFASNDNFAVVFIVQLPNISGGCFSGFQAGKWHSVHLDELRPQGEDKPRMHQLYHKSPASLLNDILTNTLTTSPVEPSSPRERHVNVREAECYMGIEDGPKLIYKREDEEILSIPPFLYQLFLTTIQSAAALIQDSESNQNRSTKRIELLLHLFGRANANDAEAMLFVRHLLRLVIALQKEQEEASGAEILLQNWLNKEAAQTENVQEAGTFRRAWTQYLEKRITPILAQVMAFIDTSRNLDLICRVDDGAWTRTLWLKLLQETKMCQEHLMMVSMKRRKHGQVMIAPYHFGESNVNFSVQTPFFWLLYRNVNTIIAEYANTGEDNERDGNETFSAVEALVSSTPYGQSLSSCVGEEEKSAFMRAYLSDFINTLYAGPGTSDDNLMILCDAVQCAARQCERDLDSLSAVQAVVYIHLVHAEVKERLHLFLEIQQIWPEVVEAVTQVKEKVSGNPLLTRDEMTLDVLSGLLLLEQLEPTKEQLNSDRGRTKWLDRVKTYLPIIEKIINATETDLQHGSVCHGSLENMKCEWARVVAVKLFLESFTNNDKFKMEERCMPLWVMLGNTANFTKIESLERIEKFLSSVHSKVEGKLTGKKNRCAHCETEFGEKLVTELSCSHRLCSICLDEAKASSEWRCPVCKKSIPKNFKPKTDTAEQRKMKQEYQEYLKCCNNFLMLVVSKLCFGGSCTPDNAVIERIFSYITRRVDKGHQTGRVYTKEMSIFNSMIDPTPVVRSFLLQLLIHKREDFVSNHLQEFFHQAQRFCQEEKDETSPETVNHIVEFSLLVIHCFEDLYHEEASGASSPVKEMEMGSQFLRNGRQGIARLGIDMPKILAIAQCRFGLLIASKYLHLVLVKNGLIRSREFHQLLHEVKNLFNVKDIEWPKKFLVKQICKEYGTDSYQTISQTEAAKWLALETDQQVKECPDRYVVCGEQYQKVREAVTKVCLGEDLDFLENIMEGNELHFLLAVHREVTMKNINTSSDAQEDLMHKLKEELMSLVSDSTLCPKEVALKLMKNEFGRPGSFLNIYPEAGLRDQSLVCVLVHIQLVFTHFNHMPHFLKPLTDLITQPQTMADKYLPTMPQDDTEALRQVLLEAIKDKQMDETVVMFCCPKGHPYAIGDCGRPYYEGRCKCGAKIGGHRHQAFEGNTPHGGVDQTRPGYILGRAADRTNHFVGERRLEGSTCAVLRFFTHAALFLGTETDPESVSGLVTPAVQEDVGEFFWQHLQKDLEIIHLASGKSVDDVFLLLHFICHQISQSDQFQETDDQVLLDKESREEWENKIASTFITPTLKDLGGCLKTCNDLMMNDHRMGQDKLMSVLYEVDKSRPTEVECLHEFPAVWRYRSRITLDHFLREFNLQIESDKNKESKMAVLSLFRKEHPFLQALYYIPNILRLQQTLMAKYRRTLNRTQAEEMTIAEMLSMLDPKSRKDIQNLFLDFVAAWDCVKERVNSEGCWTVQDGLIHLPDAYKNLKVDENSPLAVLLPSTQGPGICSYMTIEFLLRTHNEFMDKYCNIIRTSRLPEVSVRKLHSSHLVSYHPDRDLLPLVLANCNYSFELGKGTKIDYDFAGFEYQLRETILQAKSRVEQKGHVIPIDTMVYAADASNVVMFSILRDKIPQQSLPPAVKLQIMRELKEELSDICDSINNLDIAISFLKYLGGEPDLSLQKFMANALKMKQTIASQKARQFCDFKHVQSLWLLLNFEKSVVLTEKFRQDSFAHLDSQFREELSEELRTKLKEYVQSRSLDKLELLLQQMFDCLFLRVAHTDQEAVDLTTVRLGEILTSHLEASLFSLDKEQPEQEQLMKDLESFPADIQGKHIPDVWTFILHEFTSAGLKCS